MNTTVKPGDRAVAVIVRNAQVLLIHRKKSGREYYVLPGGHVEAGEDLETACLREVWEETGLTITLREKLTTIENNGRTEHYFFGFSLEGEPKLGSPERERHSLDDQYELKWVGVNRLKDIELLPVQMRQICIDAISKHIAEI